MIDGDKIIESFDFATLRYEDSYTDDDIFWSLVINNGEETHTFYSPTVTHALTTISQQGWRIVCKAESTVATNMFYLQRMR